MKIGFGFLVYNEIMNISHLDTFFNSIKHEIIISVHAKESSKYIFLRKYCPDQK